MDRGSWLGNIIYHLEFMRQVYKQRHCGGRAGSLVLPAGLFRCISNVLLYSR